MTLNRYGPAVIVCAMLVSACGQRDQDKTDEESEEEAVAIPVEVGAPVRGDIVAVYSGTAPIEAFAEADVIAKWLAKFARSMLKKETMSSRDRCLQDSTATACDSN